MDSDYGNPNYRLFNSCTADAKSKSGLFWVKVGRRHGCPFSQILFLTFMDSLSLRAVEGAQFGGHHVAFLLFADRVVLLAP